MKRLICAMLFFSTVSVYASNASFVFDNEAQRHQFQSILKNLRCLVCQNQDLLDSDAPLAQDLKTRVYTLLKANQSEAAIEAYLTERYGDFILFNPPFKPSTWLLWLAPGLFLLLGLLGIARWQRSL